MRQDSGSSPDIDPGDLEEIAAVVATVQRTQREESVGEFVALAQKLTRRPVGGAR